MSTYFGILSSIWYLREYCRCSLRLAALEVLVVIVNTHNFKSMELGQLVAWKYKKTGQYLQPKKIYFSDFEMLISSFGYSLYNYWNN